MISAINSYVSFLSFCLYWLRKQHFNLLLDLFWFHFVAWAIVETCQHILCLCCVQVVRLCREHGLYGALIYLFNQGLNDFRTPLEELLSVVQNTNSKDDASSGYEIFWLAADLWSNTILFYILILWTPFLHITWYDILDCPLVVDCELAKILLILKFLVKVFIANTVVAPYLVIIFISEYNKLILICPLILLVHSSSQARSCSLHSWLGIALPQCFTAECCFPGFWPLPLAIGA